MARRRRRMRASLAPGYSKVYFRETKAITVLGSAPNFRVGVVPVKGKSRSFAHIRSVTIGVAPKKIPHPGGVVTAYVLPKGAMCEVVSGKGDSYFSCFSRSLHVRQRRLRRKRR